jgi:hypothetical protein
VRGFFANHPNANFLEINLFDGGGFAELAAFLGVAIPSEPFPQENVASQKTPIAAAIKT